MVSGATVRYSIEIYRNAQHMRGLEERDSGEERFSFQRTVGRERDPVNRVERPR